MAKIKLPESMDDLVYFTNRTLEFEDSGVGKAKAWAQKLQCPKCKKGLMGKPVDKGKVKIRADKYVCSECGYEEEKAEHEAKLTVEILYTCPYCKKDGEATTSYKRKNFLGVPSHIFECEHCAKKLAITKKMKAAKKKKPKGKVVIPDAEDDL